MLDELSVIQKVNCPSCKQPLLYCNCLDAPEQIERFLALDHGKMDKSTYNRLVWRAAELMERRIAANEREFFSRNKDLRRFPPKKIRILKKKVA